jgi:twitching motility protein PilT
MDPGNKTLLGRVAVAAKLITIEQLNEAVREQGRTNGSKKLGDILMDLGYLTPETLQRVVALQKRVVAKAQAKRAEGEAPATPSPQESPSPGSRVSLPAAAQPQVASAPQSPDSSSLSLPLDASPLDELLRSTVECGASDLHIHAGAPVKYRVRRCFFDKGSPPLDDEEARRLVLASMNAEERQMFEEQGEIDFCYKLEGIGRFRANIYRQLRGVDGVFRFIPPQPPTLVDLGLPSSLARFTTFHQGMVLITGPTSCGKSSTMAALVNLINEERQEHILTIEDPIEYLHTSKRCLVNQRAVKRHTESFARALRAALREDPDVIVIGELRDRETVGLALSAAETGHFVLATLHTDNTIRTIRRIVGSFPPDQQEQVRAMLSESLRAIVSQRLLPTADETGLATALEIMIINRAIGNMIRENKTVQMRSVLQTGASQGMCLLDASLAQLVSSGTVTREEALRCCEDPKRIPG